MIKPEARLEGVGVEEAHNSQRLFFIQKELQLNTKFHYIEVTATLENYKITLCISKSTVKKKSFFTSAYTLSRQKKPKKISRKGKGKRRRESANKKENEKEKEKENEKGKEKKKEKEKTEIAVLKVFSSTPPPPGTFPGTVPSLNIAREQHNSHKGETREKHNSYKQ